MTNWITKDNQTTIQLFNGNKVVWMAMSRLNHLKI